MIPSLKPKEYLQAALQLIGLALHSDLVRAIEIAEQAQDDSDTWAAACLDQEIRANTWRSIVLGDSE